MRKCCLQLHRGCFKHLYLSTRKCIKLRCITAYKVREYRPCNDSILALQPFYKSWHILGSKAQTVHTRIQFYMNREVGDAFFFCLLNQCIQQMEAVHFRLQLIIEHSLECRHLRIHNDNARRNTCFAQFGTFVGHSHSQIIDMMFLQCLGNLIRACTIRRRFHHADHLGFRFQFTTIIIQVGYHGSEIHFKNRFVNLLLQFFRQSIKAKLTGTFYQYNFIF